MFSVSKEYVEFGTYTLSENTMAIEKAFQTVILRTGIYTITYFLWNEVSNTTISTNVSSVVV